MAAPKILIKRAIANLALFVVFLGLGGLIVEFGFRAYLYGSFVTPDFANHLDLIAPHPTRGWALVPNAFCYAQKFDYKVGVHVNANGLRDDETSYDKRPGTYRILLLGDSFMEAQQVDIGECLANQLELKLATVHAEVVNAGVNGYSPAQSLVYLREEGLKYKPDLVLFSFYPMNDVAECSRYLVALAAGSDSRLTFGRPYPAWDASTNTLKIEPPEYERALSTYNRDVATRKAPSWTNRSVVKKFYDDEMVKRKGISHMHEYLSVVWYAVCLNRFDTTCIEGQEDAGPKIEQTLATAWNTTLQVVSEMNRVTTESGAKFAVMTVPGKFQIEPEYRARFDKLACSPLDIDIQKPSQTVDTFCSANAISHIDLLPIFLDVFANKQGPLYFDFDDDHWTARGHLIAAEHVATFLQAAMRSEFDSRPTQP